VHASFFFIRNNAGPLLPPFNSEFRVEGKRFYKEGNYGRISDSGPGIVVKVIRSRNISFLESRRQMIRAKEPLLLILRVDQPV